jgi:branched-subunit amino acid transport protein AzlD
MKIGLGLAVVYSIIMGIVIFFCRFCPFLFPLKGKVLDFIEHTAPPVAMTVLTVYEIGTTIKAAGSLVGSVPVLAASALTALLQLWKRNALISIVGGVVLYMVLIRII